MTEQSLIPAKAAGGLSLSMLKKVSGLSEDSPLAKVVSGDGDLRLSLDGIQFQTKKGSKVLQKMQEIKEIKGKKRKVPVEFLDVVFHWVSPVIQQQLAEPWDSENPRFVPMGCWSNGDVRGAPDENAWNKQSESCDTCEYGKNGNRQCNLTRLAVVSLYSPTGEVPTYYLMNLNWGSNKKARNGNDGEDIDAGMFGFISYLEMLAGHEVELHKVVTRMHVDTWSGPKNNSKILFEVAGILEDEDAPNRAAHDKWVEDGVDFTKLCRISQWKPDADDDSVVGGDAGASEEEKPVAKKAASKKKATSKKKAAAKKKPEPEPEPEEEEDLDSFGEAEEFEEEDTETLEAEDEDDFGDLDDLLGDD